jgi:hypothetical protein
VSATVGSRVSWADDTGQERVSTVVEVTADWVEVDHPDPDNDIPTTLLHRSEIEEVR